MWNRLKTTEKIRKHCICRRRCNHKHFKINISNCTRYCGICGGYLLRNLRTKLLFKNCKIFFVYCLYLFNSESGSVTEMWIVRTVQMKQTATRATATRSQSLCVQTRSSASATSGVVTGTATVRTAVMRLKACVLDCHAYQAGSGMSLDFWCMQF